MTENPKGKKTDNNIRKNTKNWQISINKLKKKERKWRGKNPKMKKKSDENGQKYKRY